MASLFLDIVYVISVDTDTLLKVSNTIKNIHVKNCFKSHLCLFSEVFVLVTVAGHVTSETFLPLYVVGMVSYTQ